MQEIGEDVHWTVADGRVFLSSEAAIVPSLVVFPVGTQLWRQKRTTHVWIASDVLPVARNFQSQDRRD